MKCHFLLNDQCSLKESSYEIKVLRFLKFWKRIIHPLALRTQSHQLLCYSKHLITKSQVYFHSASSLLIKLLKCFYFYKALCINFQRIQRLNDFDLESIMSIDYCPK